MPLGKLTPYHHGRSQARVQYVFTDPKGRFVVQAERLGKKRRKICETLQQARYWAENLNLLFPVDKKRRHGITHLSELAVAYHAEDELKNANHKQHRYQDENLIRILHNPRIDEINQAMIHRYQTERSRERHQRRPGSVGPATVNSETARLCALVSLAVRDGLLPYNPLLGYRKLQEPPGRTRVLAMAEERLLEPECDPEFWRLVQIALHTGLRKGEQITLKQPQILWESAQIYLPKTKNSKARHVPMNKTLTAILRAQEAIGSPWVCPNRSRSNRWLERNLARYFDQAVQRAGLHDLLWHDLRHTCATRMVERGVSIVVVKEILGHSDIRVTDRYSHASKAKLFDAVFTLDHDTADDTADD